MSQKILSRSCVALQFTVQAEERRQHDISHTMPDSMTEVASCSWLKSHPDFKGANATPALSPIQILLFWEDPTALSKAIRSIRNVAEKSGCRILLEGESYSTKNGYTFSSTSQTTTLNDIEGCNPGSEDCGTTSKYVARKIQEIPQEINVTTCLRNSLSDTTRELSSTGPDKETNGYSPPCISSASSDSSPSSGSTADTKSLVSSESYSTLLSENDSIDSSSILSSSSDGSDPSVDVPEYSLEIGKLMKKKFQSRDKTLRRISQSKGPLYATLLKEKEMVVRAKASKAPELKHTKRIKKGVIIFSSSHEDSTHFSDCNGPIMETEAEKTALQNDIIGQRIPSTSNIYMFPSFLHFVLKINGLFYDLNLIGRDESKGCEDATLQERGSTKPQKLFRAWYHFFLFELYHAVPGYVTMVVYIIAHSSVYEVFYHVYLEYISNHFSYLSILLLGLFLSRISGSVWNWLDNDLYKSVKFEMHNRLRLQEADARILQWFRKKPRVKLLIDIVSSYMCFISIAYFLHSLFLPMFVDMRKNIIEGLPSKNYEMPTPIKNALLGRSPVELSLAVHIGMDETALYCFDEDSNLDENGQYCYNSQGLLTALMEEDESYLSSLVSTTSYYNLLGDSSSTLVSRLGSLSFFVANAVISTYVLFKRGHHFWE